MEYFADFDFKGFWKKDDGGFREPEPTDKDIELYEKRIGYKIPGAYIALMRQTQNGGELARCSIRFENKILNSTYLVPIAERLCTEQEYCIPVLQGVGQDMYIFFGRNLDSNRRQVFAFDYTLCGPFGEPQIIFIANTRPRTYETMVVAENFEEFARMLIKKPKAPPFDFDGLKQLLMEAAKQAFDEIVDAHSEEGIAAFGLYTDDGATMLAAATNTKKALQKILGEHPDEKEFYTYATTEWAYEGYGAEDLFASISAQLSGHVSLLASEGKITTFRNKILDLCVEVLGELKSQGYFAEKCGENIVLIANISNADLSKAKRKKIIETLN